ncbi:MAG TPA: ATP-binding protein, partial [Gemmatimonadaceae bacterium]|nr:ATP-binding protein [Gemmatimonadaceae bacterium]
MQSSPPATPSAPPLRKLRVALEVEIPSDVRYIEQVVDVIARQCRQLSYSERQTTLNVPVALTEALSNAILRGNGEEPTRHVQVRADVDRDRLVVEVVDEGTGFDLA